MIIVRVGQTDHALGNECPCREAIQGYTRFHNEQDERINQLKVSGQAMEIIRLEGLKDNMKDEGFHRI